MTFTTGSLISWVIGFIWGRGEFWTDMTLVPLTLAELIAFRDWEKFSVLCSCKISSYRGKMKCKPLIISLRKTASLLHLVQKSYIAQSFFYYNLGRGSLLNFLTTSALQVVFVLNIQNQFHRSSTIMTRCDYLSAIIFYMGKLYSNFPMTWNKYELYHKRVTNPAIYLNVLGFYLF